MASRQEHSLSLTETRAALSAEEASAAARYPLIGPDDPPPYSIYNAGGQAPVLLVCDHASKAFPRAMNQLGVADWVLGKHVACDIGAGMVTRFLADRLDAPAVLAGYSRLIVDLNRQTHTDSAFIKVSDGIAIPGNLDLCEDEKAERIASFFTPYHDAISRQLDMFEARGITPAFLAIHTCTPVFNRVVRQMHIGVMWDEDPRIPVPLIRNLGAMEGVCVGDNEPYSGRHPHDFTIDHHAERKGLPYAGVEVRQDLVDEERGAAKWAAVLADALEDVLADVVGYDPEARAVSA
jgi:predicted N-formylglutamate amidohydrolase